MYAGGGAGGGGRLRHVPAAVRRGAGQGRRLLGHAPRRRARQQGQRAALQGGQVWWVLLLRVRMRGQPTVVLCRC